MVPQLVSLAAVGGTPQSAVHVHLQVRLDIQRHALSRQILNIAEPHQEDHPVPDPHDSYTSQMQAFMALTAMMSAPGCSRALWFVTSITGLSAVTTLRSGEGDLGGAAHGICDQVCDHVWHLCQGRSANG
jgi:hypothetical protein